MRFRMVLVHPTGMITHFKRRGGGHVAELVVVDDALERAFGKIVRAPD